MPAALESGFFGGNVPAWHGLGTVIEREVVSTREALHLAELDWLVSKEPVLHYPGVEVDEDAATTVVPEGDANVVPGAFFTIRNHDQKVLGIVGRDYKVLDNHEAFAFGDDILDSGDAKWHTAGSLHGGKRVWMLAKLSDQIVPGGEETEAIDQYLLISTSHDGSTAITAAVTPVRVVCQNTLTMALTGNPRAYRIRHTASMDGRIAEARKTLGLAMNYGQQLKSLAEDMMMERFTSADFMPLMNDLIPVPEKEGAGRSRALNQRQQLHYVWKASDNLDNVRHTKWGMLQAVVEYHDHHTTSKNTKDSSSEENRFKRIVDGAPLVQRAYDLLTV